MTRYKNNEDLPEIIRVALPGEAQTIYRRAYNDVWSTRRNNEDRLDEQAHRAGWAAVEEVFEHDETTGSWQRKAEPAQTNGGILDHLKNLIS